MADGDRLDKHEKQAKIVSAYAGLLLPFAVVAATALFNHSNQVIAARQKCIDQSLQILGSAYAAPLASPTQEDERRKHLATISDFAVQSCKTADLKLPGLVFQRILEEKQQAAGTPAGEALGKVETQAREITRTPSAPLRQSATVPQSGALRVFIHISEERQRGAAAALADRLRSTTVNERSISVPGIELVPNGGDNSLRCLKRVDCGGPRNLLDLVNSALAAPKLSQADLSARFDRATSVRPGTYEIWFGPGEIVVAR